MKSWELGEELSWNRFEAINMQVSFDHRFVCVRGNLVSLCGECDEPAGYESWEI